MEWKHRFDKFAVKTITIRRPSRLLLSVPLVQLVCQAQARASTVYSLLHQTNHHVFNSQLWNQTVFITLHLSQEKRIVFLHLRRDKRRRTGCRRCSDCTHAPHRFEWSSNGKRINGAHSRRAKRKRNTIYLFVYSAFLCVFLFDEECCGFGLRRVPMAVEALHGSWSRTNWLFCLLARLLTFSAGLRVGCERPKLIDLLMTRAMGWCVLVPVPDHSFWAIDGMRCLWGFNAAYLLRDNEEKRS